ncbi:hypothetical protein N7471_010589 [Penicillium samsonianum]|uniref:uncharacterized protein n=1 Tax=Penicillium samsonianum TaxID=1882272 RepID=UPI002546AD4F|nr:uncharacterized protein N7471_010589 [Penicillium samsonianum]KAJ6126096.1 hypothetical protein N7471_010589 [Penicillium samsonianum]
MTIRNLAPPSKPSIPASLCLDENNKDINTAQICFEMLSQTIAAESCMENSQRLFRSLDFNPSPDECIDLLQRTLLSLDQVFLGFPPQSHDEVVLESWSMIERARAMMQSTILKLEDLKNGPERSVELDHNFEVNQSV